MTESNALLAEALNMKLAAIPIVYTLVNDSVKFTPNTLNEMKKSITAAKKRRMLSRVCSAAPTSRIERERNRRSL